MLQIEESVTIERPIEAVWAFVMDVEREPLWQTSIEEVRIEGGGPLTAGARVTEVRWFLGRRIETVWEMVEAEEPHRSSITSIVSPFPWASVYQFEAVGDATRYTVSLTGDPGGFFRIAASFLQRAGRRELVASLGNLKDLLETEPHEVVAGEERSGATS